MRLSIALLILIAPAAAQARSEATPARALAGRVAGAPLSCVPPLGGDTGSQMFASGDILYRGRGSRVYLNHPRDCPSLVPNRAIVSRTPIGRSCRGDIIDVIDPQTGISYGSCPLGDFVPYDRVR